MPAIAQEIELTPVEKLQQQTQALEEEVADIKKLKISGYIQGQFQSGQRDASLKVGSANENRSESFNRFGIRRGRVKFTYKSGIASGVFQLDITEKGLGVKDAYLNINDPWAGSNSLRAGIFDRPFGFEISHSSSVRESPERSTIFQTLFPDERDLGAMLILQAPKTSPWSILKLEAGLFAGNGIKQETDNRRDFIGHLSASKTIGNSVSFGLGASYYNGGVYQGTDKVYTMKDNAFVLSDDPDNKGRFAKREYVGFDFQFGLSSVLGMTKLRAEYIFGQQPGTLNSTKSPNASSLPTSDTYIRNFNGGYVTLVQDLGTLPVAVVAKYDWYDPNTKLARDQAGMNGTTGADLSKHTFGFGAMWNISSALRLQAYYDIMRNEKSVNVAGMDKDVKDNVFTLRLQYKF